MNIDPKIYDESYHHKSKMGRCCTLIGNPTTETDPQVCHRHPHKAGIQVSCHGMAMIERCHEQVNGAANPLFSSPPQTHF